MIPQDAVLLIIDVQKGFDSEYWGVRNNPDAEERIADLLQIWRDTGRPVVHVRHLSDEPESPLRAGQPGAEIKPIVAPRSGEKLITKRVNSAFIGTDLEAHLRDNGYSTLVIAGLTANHCVSTTTRMAGNLGFTALLVSDATAAYGRRSPTGHYYAPELIHDTALTSLHGEFAEVLTMDAVLERL